MRKQLLFVYGTLMHAPVFESVTGRAAGEMIPARLSRIRRSCITGVAFPGIVPEENAYTDGLLVEVNAESLALLDAFEGAWYKRETVEVEREDGQKITAEVYVLEEKARSLINPEPWEFEKFLAVDLHSFLND